MSWQETQLSTVLLLRGNQPQGWRTKGKCHRASQMLSCQLSEVSENKTHFLINVFISFVHDKRFRGDKWERKGGGASEGTHRAKCIARISQVSLIVPGMAMITIWLSDMTCSLTSRLPSFYNPNPGWPHSTSYRWWGTQEQRPVFNQCLSCFPLEKILT